MEVFWRHNAVITFSC